MFGQLYESNALGDLPLYQKLLILAVILVGSGFFSIAETSFMAVNKYRIRYLAGSGSKGAKRVQSLLSKTDQLLGALLLGNNLLNAAAATLVGVIGRDILGDSPAALGMSTVLVTFAILVFSEITPKVAGAIFPERISISIGFVLTPLLRLTHPLVWFVNLFVNVLLTLSGIKHYQKKRQSGVSLEEIRSMVLETKNMIPAQHHLMLLSLVDLDSISVEEIMIPRSQIKGIDISQDVGSVKKQLAACQHRRVPLWNKNCQETVGILNTRQALDWLLHKNALLSSLTAQASKPHFIPASTSALQQLTWFQQKHHHIAFVTNEYGDITGLITLDDIVEEIFGSQLNSGSLDPHAQETWEKEHCISVDGSTLLRDLNRFLGVSLPLGGPKTLNGLILAHLQGFPEAAVAIKVGSCVLEATHVRHNRIHRVKLWQIPTSDPTE